MFDSPACNADGMETDNFELVEVAQVVELCS